MKTVKLQDVIDSENHVKADTWESRRLVLKKDNMGYSVHDTVIKAGTETHIWYQNHLESVYCIEGEGEVETVKDGKVWPIEKDTIYVLDQNDEHYLRAKTDMRMVCVFNPPITGQETHDENGVYPLVED
ncbi:L-ectoine synthase [Thalassobacillus devorans]|uniref:L-ectoine synthase n=1 Tax=Thalassobacillus devorans TaxID=279813 RepID=A0ABQ1PND0_9BACI|nr:ectoine synthase [Thalassobacillus devorans]NIK30277.1 L-ectoine synthase [Thalassobacillus devorans]GGC99799.1 L-ectoine synthase [Thalassobacillus devorans]